MWLMNPVCPAYWPLTRELLSCTVDSSRNTHRRWAVYSNNPVKEKKLFILTVTIREDLALKQQQHLM